MLYDKTLSIKLVITLAHPEKTTQIFQLSLVLSIYKDPLK
jgi:hypothetical protein